MKALFFLEILFSWKHLQVDLSDSSTRTRRAFRSDRLGSWRPWPKSDSWISNRRPGAVRPQNPPIFLRFFWNQSRSGSLPVGQSLITKSIALFCGRIANLAESCSHWKQRTVSLSERRNSLFSNQKKVEKPEKPRIGRRWPGFGRRFSNYSTFLELNRRIFELTMAANFEFSDCFLSSCPAFQRSNYSGPPKG